MTKNAAVLKCLASGMDATATGRFLKLQPRTVQAYISKMKFDYDALTSCQLVYIAFRDRLINMDDFKADQVNDRIKKLFEKNRNIITLLAEGKTQHEIGLIIFRSYGVVKNNCYILKLCANAGNMPHVIAMAYYNHFFDKATI